jgi:hypothetical protein
MFHTGHRRPVTRRDFLAQGFLTGAAVIASPSLFGLLKGEASAQAACSLGAAGGIPFIGLDLSGGANIAGSNVLVGRDGQLDALSVAGYEKLGLPSDMTPQGVPAGTDVFDDSAGLLFHFDSAMMRGIKTFASPETLAKVNGMVICARSANDTGNNTHNPIYGINAAGAMGSLVPLIGTQSSDSGGRSMVPAKMFDPAVRPTKVDRPSDASGLVDTGYLSQMLPTGGAGSVMSAIKGISDDKVARMAEQQVVADLVNCAYSKSADLVVQYGDPSQLDPRNDPRFVGPTGLFATANDLDSRSEYRKISSVAKLICEGHAGAATVEFGGYDYHNSTRATGEVKDLRAGEAIGIALEFAARQGTNLAMYVFSDGSVASDGVLDNSAAGRGKGIWKGDNSSTAAVFMLVYQHDAIVRPALRRPDLQQIGFMRDSASVETAPGGAATQISNAPGLLAEAIVLNYLGLMGRENEYATVMGGNPGLVGNYIDELVAFAPIV